MNPNVPSVRLGLDLLSAEGFSSLKGQRVGLLCHAASVSSALVHLTQEAARAGLNVVRCFGPEHGIWADAQDMIPVGSAAFEPVTGAPVVSLYGGDEASLSPTLEALAGLDALVVDLQDVGARYYTYIYTAAFALKAAGKVGLPVYVLDRPNPLGGERLEGGMIRPGFTSFVGQWSLPTRHGLTIGEVLSLLNAREAFGADLRVVPLLGWERASYHDQTGLPWVQPSPNMPTLDTALVYPGMCLLEGTNLSEGRGTTRPFELFGADFIEPFSLCQALAKTPLEGVAFRPVFIRPTFHKFAGQAIGGAQLHVTDRARFEPLRTGLHLLATLRRLYGEALCWRREAYEFVQDRLAIDLLFGGAEARLAIDEGQDVDALWRSWQLEARAFNEERAPYLRYR